MQKVIVIGCPGSGKSTFARKLRDKTGLPLYYLDQIWHKPDKTNISTSEFDQRLVRILNTDSWIIDGNYLRTLELRLQYCDTVFFLDLPTDICIKSVQSRIGTKREDMPWIEEEFDSEFYQWITDFPAAQRPQILSLLEKYSSKTIFTFNTRAEVNTFLTDFPAQTAGTEEV